MSESRHPQNAFGLRPLLRLTLWGGAAAGALLLVLLAANSDTGRKQLMLARQALIGPVSPPEPPKPALPTAAQLLARSQDAEAEARRLADAVRVLSADRDRLMARIGALERALEDVTGSIAAGRNAQPDAIPSHAAPAHPLAAAPAPATPSALAPSKPDLTGLAPTAPMASPPDVAPTLVAPPVMPRSSTPSAPSPPELVPPVPATSAKVVAPPTPPETTLPTPEKAPIELSHPREPGRSVTVEPVAPTSAPAWATALVTQQPIITLPSSPLPPATRPQPAETTTTKTEYAVDVGGAADIDALREVWRAAKSRYSALEALRPVVAIRDNGKQPGPTELRLVMGPLPSATAAAKLCASLSTAGLACYPTVFEGQKLAWR